MVFRLETGPPTFGFKMLVSGLIPPSGLKGSDDGVLNLEESCFWTLSIVCVYKRNTTFRKLDLFPSSGKVMWASAVLGPLERELAPITGPRDFNFRLGTPYSEY
jgi:hypothetical protein